MCRIDLHIEGDPIGKGRGDKYNRTTRADITPAPGTRGKQHTLLASLTKAIALLAVFLLIIRGCHALS
jgi:hypothetical protein